MQQRRDAARTSASGSVLLWAAYWLISASTSGWPPMLAMPDARPASERGEAAGAAPGAPLKRNCEPWGAAMALVPVWRRR